MAVAFDSVGPSSAGAGQTNTSTLSWSHTTVAAHAWALVAIAVDNVLSITTATWDGVSMGTAVSTILLSSQPFAIYSVPDTGTAGSHTVSFTASAATTDMVGGSMAYTGVGSVGTPVTTT